MKRSDLINLAWGQLEAARESRRKMLVWMLEGNQGKAALYRGCAMHYLLAARYMQRDAHTEQYRTLRLRGIHAGNDSDTTEQMES